MQHIGIVVAMSHELDALCEFLLPQASRTTYQGSQVVTGEKDGITYTIFQSGIGTTNAAVGAADLLFNHQPEAVFNLGTAALISAAGQELQAGDVLIGKAHYQWDLDISGPITPEWSQKRSFVDVLKAAVLHPDRKLLATATQLNTDGFRCTTAACFTGNSFFTSSGQREFLPSVDAPVAVDMESFAVAQVCARKDIPFISLRGITDTGEEGANDDFYTNVHRAATASAKAAHALAMSLR